MAEEFQESEIVFEEEGGRDLGDGCRLHHQLDFRNNYDRKKAMMGLTTPVKIPENAVRRRCCEAFGCGDGGEDMLPPHVITGRRAAAAVAGSGRAALRGRDLYRVRNSVLRMTGFIET